MSSHFSAIGFELKESEDLRPPVDLAFREGKPFPSRNGRYIQWRGQSGVELWLALDNEENLITLHPHFSGQGVMAVGITRGIIRDSQSALVGGFYAVADPKDGIESGGYPFVFDVPSFDLYADASLPLIRKIQLAAFAHELSVFAGDDEFLAAQKGLRWAPESFVAPGLFSVSADQTSSPAATAMFAGHVLKHSLITNQITRAAFLWLKVQTLGGVMDVVADPADVQGSPRVGGVIKGSFWLSGRILE